MNSLNYRLNNMTNINPGRPAVWQFFVDESIVAQTHQAAPRAFLHDPINIPPKVATLDHPPAKKVSRA
jgi:hypothetical protein